ncbi:hypothetical protein F4811DRAFT_560093 [Daldinia bambusicola]|nr:hypothetical protein F4811DRAFT_560093 [Daldinia bambusicola]
MAGIYDVSSFEWNRKWYQEDLVEVNEPIRRLLEQYSKVPGSEVIKLVKDIRERAFATSPYPCIGLFRFTNLTLITHPLYNRIVDLLKSSSTEASYLDIGCCFGQDLRQLVLDGVRSERLEGLDIEKRLLDLGYELFLDRGTLKANFVISDILRGKGKEWKDLMERGFDVIHCSAVFHLFTLDKEIAEAKNIARMMGNIKPGDYPALMKGSVCYRHDLRTFGEKWKKVGEASQTRWKVEGTMGLLNIDPNNTLESENSRRLLFTVTRIE